MRDSMFKVYPELTVPPFHFSVTINAEGRPQLAGEELVAVLPKMSDETLAGLFGQANQLLKKKKIMHDEAIHCLNLSIFPADGKKLCDFGHHSEAARSKL